MKKTITLLLAIMILLGIMPTVAVAAADYSEWNGCYETVGLDKYSDYSIYFDFDALICIRRNSKDAFYKYELKKLSDTKFEYAVSATSSYTYELLDDATLLCTAPPKTYSLIKSDTYSDEMQRESARFERYEKGLGYFSADKVYDSAFTDVSADSWYFSSVKSVYQYSVMDGMGQGVFLPEGVVSLAQAITVSSRIHSQYHKGTIEAVDGSWYAKYVAYAQRNGLLPEGFDANTDLNAAASREFMAYVFSCALDEIDLPRVNNGAVIPDIDDASANCREAIRSMYFCGIMTGMEDGSFLPKSQATRAQMATILMRLIEPAERICSDPKLDAAFLKNESNVMNYVPLYSIDEKNSMAFSYDKNSGFYYTNLVSNGSRSKAVGEKYVNLVADKDYYYYSYPTYGKVGNYTKRQYETLLRQSVKGGQSQMLYRTTDPHDSIDAITCYDGVLYFLTSGLDDNYVAYAHLYRLGSSGTPEKLLTMDELTDKLTAFNGKLYYSKSNTIFAYDLSTGENERILSYANEWVMYGGTIYYLDYSGNVKKLMCQLPDYNKTMAKLPGGIIKGMLNYTDGTLYVFPNCTSFTTLFTCDNDGLHEFCDLKRDSLYNMGILGEDIFFTSLFRGSFYATSEGIVYKKSENYAPNKPLYDYVN